MEAPLSVFFSATGVVYGLFVPLVIVQLLLLLFIPALLRSGASVKGIAEASYCYIMMTIGVVLMTLGAIPTIYSVLGGYVFDGSVYIGLLLVFAFGGAVFLWHEQECRLIDSNSRAVPAAVFVTMFKIVGRLLAILAALSLVLSIILRTTTEYGWWVTPFIMLVYGLLVTWVTRADKSKPIFQSSPMQFSALRTAKTASRKAGTTKRRSSRRKRR